MSKSRQFSKEHCEKLRQTSIGKKHSEETRKKMSLILKQMWQDPEYRKKMGNARSFEWKRKISIAHKGMIPSKEARRNMSLSLKKRWKKLNEKKRAIMKEFLVADKRFSYIKGCVEGDGWFGDRSTHLATIDTEWATYFSQVIKEWSGITPTLKLRKQKPHDLWLVNLYNRFVMEFIRDTEPTDFLEFLKGFADAEGSFTHPTKAYHRKRVLRLANSNIELLNTIKTALLEHGINVGIYGPYKGVYSLAISNNKGILWFYKNIGFRIRRKQERLEEWVKWLRAFHTEKYLENKVYMTD